MTTAVRFSIVVPMNYNDGTPCPIAHNCAREMILARFGGSSEVVTHGQWEDESGNVLGDESVTIWTDVTIRTDGRGHEEPGKREEVRAFFRKLAEFVAGVAEQESVYLAECDILRAFVNNPRGK